MDDTICLIERAHTGEKGARDKLIEDNLRFGLEYRKAFFRQGL